MNLKLKSLPILLLTFILSSCGDEVFSVGKNQISNSTPGQTMASQTKCSSFTYIKPHVNFVFMWDNSSSKYLMNAQLKNSLNETLYKISERFDYRVMLAPIQNPNDNNIIYIAENPDGLPYNIKNRLQSKESGVMSLGFLPPAQGSDERGLTTTQQVLKLGTDNNFLRKDGHTIVVIMSNGDDRGGCHNSWDMQCESAYVENAANNIRDILERQMKSVSYHLYTMVPHRRADDSNNPCLNVGNGRHTGKNYRAASAAVSGAEDSIDICGGTYTHIFDKINNDIEDKILGHVYKYWPIVEADREGSVPPFDQFDLDVVKISGEQEIPLVPGRDYTYVGFDRKATREFPTAGEEKTGYFIELLGNAKVAYPDCLRINTRSRLVCYRYVHLQNKPLESSIDVTINGKKIPNSAVNGWTLVGYRNNQNVRTRCEGVGYDSGTEYKTGYFLELHGDAIYGNSSTINVNYLPAPLDQY